MNKSLFVTLIIAGLLFTACVPKAPESEAADTSQPNIVYILADDLGIGDLTCYNPDSKIPTPNMDRLAREGMRFDDAHSNSAVCTPTRYGVLTGRYAFRTRLKSGVLGGFSPRLIPPERMTVGALLRDHGYHTAAIGKWHLGLDWARVQDSLPLVESKGLSVDNTENVDYEGYVGGGPWDCGFNYGYILPASLDIAPYCYIENGRLPKPITGQIEGANEERGVFWRPADIQQDFKLEETLNHFRDQAVSYIQKRASDPDQPFFLYFPLTAPHTPWLPTEEVRGKSEAGRYGDFVVQVDNVVGAVLQALEENGFDENTMVILTSDNGSHWKPEDKAQFDHLANYIYRGMKSDAWEGGHRMPFLVRWPAGITAGAKSDEVLCHTDLLATCADLVDAELPAEAGEDSYSFLPVLTGEKPDKAIRPHTVHHSINGTFAIRRGKWKLIDAPGSGGWSYQGREEDPPVQLYDMESDPGEQHNLQAEFPEVVQELSKLLAPYQKAGTKVPAN